MQQLQVIFTKSTDEVEIKFCIEVLLPGILYCVKSTLLLINSTPNIHYC